MVVDKHRNSRPWLPQERGYILNVGGFSVAVFEVLAAFVADDAARFVAQVETIEL
jgi:60 kDa SS-A/Ro ribonucleoprotein